MRPDCQTARSYQRVNELIKNVEKWLEKNSIDIFEYSRKVIAQRIAQALVMQILTPFLRQSIQDPHHLEAQALKLDGIILDQHSGAVRPNAKLFLRNTGKFFAVWVLVLGYWAKSFAANRKGTGPVVLLHGVPDADLRAGGNPSRFESFCNDGPLAVLNQAQKIIIQSVAPIQSIDAARFSYARFPLLALFAQNRMSTAENIRFLAAHFALIAHYLVAVIRLPVASMLWRDFSFHAVARSLDRRHLISDNLITNTNWLQQFLWMTDLPNRNFSTSMILYSLNSSPLLFKDDPVPANHPGIRHLRADIVYIWDEEYEDILREEQVLCKTKAVGPILWYLSLQLPIRSKNNVLRICVFDVSPLSQHALRNIGLSGHFYSVQTMKLFLDDILMTGRQAEHLLDRKVEIVLKHKRTPTPVHDRAYFDYVRELCASNENLYLAAEDENLYSLVGGSDIVIVIPYSSPAHIASYLKVPAVFYDPTGDILPSDVNSKVQFCAGRNQLTETLIRHFRE